MRWLYLVARKWAVLLVTVPLIFIIIRPLKFIVYELQAWDDSDACSACGRTIAFGVEYCEKCDRVLNNKV